jgi:hypothetical protein
MAHFLSLYAIIVTAYSVSTRLLAVADPRSASSRRRDHTLPRGAKAPFAVHGVDL